MVRTKRFALDQIKLLERTCGEDDITLFNRAHMIYRYVEPMENGKDYVSTLFGKLLVQYQQRLLDIFEIEDLLFRRLIAYYQTKGRK